MVAWARFDGIIDIHAHADPDKTRRSPDVLEMARLYRDRGFRGLVLMNHFDPTGGQAWMPIHTFAWTELLDGMREFGLTEDEIGTMTKTNLARLLGLE